MSINMLGLPTVECGRKEEIGPRLTFHNYT